jgi:hypothetical protein
MRARPALILVYHPTMYLIDSPPESLGMRRHLPARLGATPACLCAILHMGIILIPFAVFSTQSRLGAQCAGSRVPRRAPEHEIATRLTDVGPIEQQPNMAGFGKDRRFSAGLQWRMLGRMGWAVIRQSERGPVPRGALQSGRPGDWRGSRVSLGGGVRWLDASAPARAGVRGSAGTGGKAPTSSPPQTQTRVGVHSGRTYRLAGQGAAKRRERELRRGAINGSAD